MPFVKNPNDYQDEFSKKLLADNLAFDRKNLVDPVALYPKYKMGEYALRAGKVLFVSGEPGTGKTTAIIKFGVKYGIPVYLVPCNSSMPKSALIGKRIFNPHKGVDGDERETLFVPISLLESYQKGYICLLDDFLQCTEGTRTEAMEFALLPENYICVDDSGKQYHRHPNFRVAVTGNLNYRGNQCATPAQNSRLAYTIVIGHPPKKNFLLCGKSKAPWITDTFFNQAYDLCTAIMTEGKSNGKNEVCCGFREMETSLVTIFEAESDITITLDDFKDVIESTFINCLYKEKVPMDKIEAFSNTPVIQAFITKMYNEYKSSPRPLAPGMSQQAQAVKPQQTQQPIKPPTPKSGMDLFDDLYDTRI